jgi:hypothetical protein
VAHPAISSSLLLVVVVLYSSRSSSLCVLTPLVFLFDYERRRRDDAARSCISVFSNVAQMSHHGIEQLNVSEHHTTAQ